MSAPRLPMKDSYYLYRGTSNLFCIQGYSPPKTQLANGMSIALQSAKKCDLFPAIGSKSRDPSPSHYADGPKKWLKSTWNKPTGKFLPTKRETMTERVIKASINTPGPGTYSPTTKKVSNKFGKFEYFIFSKAESRTLLNNTQALAEEIPAPNEYFKEISDRDRAYSLTEPRSPVFKYIKSEKKTIREKHDVGPGYLKDFEKSSKFIKNKTPEPIFLKAKKFSTFQKNAEKSKFVPGVGTYENVEKAYKKFSILQNTGKVFTSKARLIRMTEQAGNEKSWIPGPGSYNAISFFKLKN